MLGMGCFCALSVFVMKQNSTSRIDPMNENFIKDTAEPS